MTFVVRHRGDTSRPIVAVYTCPEHGEFDAIVQRDQNGEAPDTIACPVVVDELILGVLPREPEDFLLCEEPATWTPSPVACRVRRVEVSRGKWEKPERKTYLDTRKLGEGQDVEDFQAERKKIWTERRRQEVKELLR